MLGLVGLTGCSQPTTVGPAKMIASGNVTWNKQPLAKGQVVFVDSEGDSPRTYGGEINNGRYQFEVTPGKKRVEISAREAQGVSTDPGANLRELIPPKYNTKTTLTAEFVKGKEAPVNFDLTSDGAAK